MTTLETTPEPSRPEAPALAPDTSRRRVTGSLSTTENPAKELLRWAVGLPGAVAAQVAITAADITTGPKIVLVSLLALPVLWLSLTAWPRQVAGLGLLATAITAASGVWDHNLGTFQYGERLATVAVASLIAVVTARALSQREAARWAERRARTQAERAQRVAEQQRLRAEATIRQLQLSLLPPRLPELAHWTIAASFRPGAAGVEVGGDFYDVVRFEDELFVVVGDVTGKGIGPAIVGTTVRHAARAIASHDRRPEAAFRTINDLLLADAERIPVTMVCARFTRHQEGTCFATVASAGHPLPYRIRPSGAIESVGKPGILLGALPSNACEWPSATIRVEPWDTLFFFTDGVTEAGGPLLRLGEQRLGRIVVDARGDVEDILAAVGAEIAAFDAAGRRDDAAMVALRYRG
jgi:phosphoserine phosphatase RsbU/P